jgi:hypothetical protein
MQTPRYVQLRPWLGLIFGFWSEDVHGGPLPLMYQLM